MGLKMGDLSIADERFCALVVEGKSLSDAYRLTRPKSKASEKSIIESASRLTASSKVASRICQLKSIMSEKLEITVERVLRERARLAFFDPRKMLHGDGTPKAIHELDDDTAAAIAGFDVVSIGSDKDRVGQVNKVKMADKNASLTALEKHLNMYKDIDLGNGILNININLGD